MSGYVIPANYNSPVQTIVFGEIAAVDEVDKVVKSAG
jgi:hypothetical protein